MINTDTRIEKLTGQLKATKIFFEHTIEQMTQEIKLIKDEFEREENNKIARMNIVDEGIKSTIKKFCDEGGVKYCDVMGKNSISEVVKVRRRIICMLHGKNWSPQKIQRVMGVKSHASVVISYKKIKRIRAALGIIKKSVKKFCFLINKGYT